MERQQTTRFGPYYRVDVGMEAATINAARSLIPLQRVRVLGPSMVPTLRHGETVLVRHGARIQPGDVVLATFRDLPDRMVIKRAVRVTDNGWWLVSDNPAAGGDSAVHGVADVHGRVLLRLRPGRPRRVR